MLLISDKPLLTTATLLFVRLLPSVQVKCPDVKKACPGNSAIVLITKFANTPGQFKAKQKEFIAGIANAASVSPQQVVITSVKPIGGYKPSPADIEATTDPADPEPAAPAGPKGPDGKPAMPGAMPMPGGNGTMPMPGANGTGTKPQVADEAGKKPEAPKGPEAGKKPEEPKGPEAGKKPEAPKGPEAGKKPEEPKPDAKGPPKEEKPAAPGTPPPAKPAGPVSTYLMNCTAIPYTQIVKQQVALDHTLGLLHSHSLLPWLCVCTILKIGVRAAVVQDQSVHPHLTWL